MRANIYTLDGLTPEIKQQVYGGLEMLGEHVGGIDIHKSFRLNGLKRNVDGTVDAASGIKGLDYLIELHVIALPVGPIEQYGYGASRIGSGVSIYNTYPTFDEGHGTRVVAHEGAHSLGYVLPRNDGSKDTHCRDDRCVMKPLTDQEFEMAASKFRSTYGNIFGGGLDLGAIGRLFAEVDFCDLCTDEMSQTHQEKIAALRHTRWMEKRVDPFVIGDAIALERPAS